MGGGTLSSENQFLPIQISREALPADVPAWGKRYKDHIRNWQHIGVVRIQPDSLPYTTNFLDLDPRHRDRSGLGLPVVRITCDMRPNEQRQADWMEGISQEILHGMGASKTWRGPRFTGVGSSHDLGGCRMGRRSGPLRRRPRLAGPRHAGVVRLQRRHLSVLPRRQPDADLVGAGAACRRRDEDPILKFGCGSIRFSAGPDRHRELQDKEIELSFKQRRHPCNTLSLSPTRWR